MNGPLALVGSGEFTDALNDADHYLLSLIKNPNVAIIPTAAGLEDSVDKWINDGIRHFHHLGATAAGVKILNSEDAHSMQILDQLKSFNFFYFSGGDPGYLLRIIKDSPAWDLIKKSHQQGSILAGSSAGAMVLGSKVWDSIYKFINNGDLLPWGDGLNIVSFGILPHYDAAQKDFQNSWEKILANLPDTEIVGIDEDTAYISYQGAWKVMGQGKIYQVH